jgi:hypothetical integral membrane protein (TIGR02206 family)
MGDFFAGLEYQGEPFILFGVPHLIGLGIVLGINLALFYLKRKGSAKTQDVFRYGLATLLILDELAWHFWNWKTGQWSIKVTLPLHICSVFVFLSALMLLTKSYTIYEFAYLLGIPAALQALLTPDAGIWGFPHFRFFQVIVSHGAIITAAMYMTIVEDYRPTWKSVKRVAVGANLYMLGIALVNALIGSNYLYIARKPETPSLIDLMPAWPWYILIIEALGISFVLLLYLPFAVRDWRKRWAH